jgi:hypothetical protein
MFGVGLYGIGTNHTVLDTIIINHQIL